MDVLGNKIRTLRKNKNITQEKLAEILNVSTQAISKWENKQSLPDVELLPVIARYFGITMDELFNYRLDALNYKERFIRFMVDNGVLQFGKFQLLSGRVSPYYIDTSKYKSASQIKKLGEFYTECIRENNVQLQYLYGHHIKTIPLVISTSMVLFDKCGIDVGYCIEDVGELSIEKNAELLIVEDTLTSGKTLREIIKKIKNEVEVKIVGIVVSVDRQENMEHSFRTARENLEKEYGVKLFSIVTMEDIMSAMKSGVISAEYLEQMTEYKVMYGGRYV